VGGGGVGGMRGGGFLGVACLCGLIMCNTENLIIRRPRPDFVCCATEKNKYNLCVLHAVKFHAREIQIYFICIIIMN